MDPQSRVVLILMATFAGGVLLFFIAPSISVKAEWRVTIRRLSVLLMILSFLIAIFALHELHLISPERLP